MSKEKIAKSDLSPETLKNAAIRMSLVSVYLPHICISNGEKRRLRAALRSPHIQQNIRLHQILPSIVVG